MPTRVERIQKSKEEQNDEFYTIYADIAAELPNYKEYLRGKRILCPCDWDESFEEQIVYSDGTEVLSNDLFNDCNFIKDINIDETKKAFEKKIDLIKCNFIKFLVSHADTYGIKTISVSGYDPNTEKGVRFQDIDYSKYDLIITNPPFSQFREFINTMFKNDKKFLVIGPQNALTYRECFRYVQENKMWLGYHFHMTGFVLPDGTQIAKSDNRVRSCCWFTNLEVKIRHDELILTEKYTPEKFPSYYNFDGIDVTETKDIPYDYDGYIGVPITFMQKYNPDQFEIIGLGAEIEKKYLHTTDGDKIHYIDKETNKIMYTFPYTVSERKIGNGLRINDNGKPGKNPFGRIIIRNKKVRKDED